jgi:hypothetical protein
MTLASLRAAASKRVCEVRTVSGASDSNDTVRPDIAAAGLFGGPQELSE